MRPGISIAALLFAAGVAFSPPAWQFREELPIAAMPAIVGVPLEPGVFHAARTDLADLRVVHDGREVPYVLERLSGHVEDREVPAEILDKSVSGGALQLTLAARRPGRHNRVRIATPHANFRQHVMIETSNDNRNWSVVRRDAELFDFTSKDRAVSVLSVDYPESTRPYVRLTIAGWQDPDLVSGAWIRFRNETPAARTTLASLDPRPVEDPATHSTVFTLDLGTPLPCSRLEFDVDTPAFSREAEVESSPDAKQWTFVSRGLLSRFAARAAAALDFVESRERYLRIHIFNHDDAPLEIQRVRVETDGRRVEFESGGSGAWWLYYGNPEAKAPQYDLAAVLAHRDSGDLIVVQPGPGQTNPDYRPPSPRRLPWTERHPALLYITLALAILFLGGATLWFLRGVTSSPGGAP